MIQSGAEVLGVWVQVWRWAQQYRSQLTGPPLPQMTALISWLEAHIPAEDSDASVTRISHGDYRCGSRRDGSEAVLALASLFVLAPAGWVSSFGA